MASDYETQSRLALLKGASTPPPADVPAPDVDLDAPEHLVPRARRALAEIMDDPTEEAKDRVNAADSILDRYGEPRKKFELGGSRTLNINVPPSAFSAALEGMAKVFGKEIPSAKLRLAAPPPADEAVHGEGVEPPTS